MPVGALVLITATLVGQAAPAAPARTDALAQAYLLFLQARDLEDRADVAGALSAFRRAAELCPESAEIRAALAELLARDGQADAALKEGASALAIEPDNRSAHRLLGLLQAEVASETKDAARASALVSEAIQHLEVVAADRLVDPVGEVTLGRLYVQAGRDAKAIDTLRLFLLDRPDDLDAAMLLATAYEHTGNLPAARDTLAAAAAGLRPDEPRLLTWLADLQEQTGDWRAAAGVWAQLVQAAPRNGSYRLRQATALANAGDAAGGRRVVAALIERSPQDADAWYLLSQIDRRAGERAQAEEDARRIIAIDAADPRGPLALASAKAAGREYRAVIDLLEPRVRNPRAEDVEQGWFAQMAAELAAAYGEAGDRGRAVSVLEAARRRDEKNAGLQFELGAAYERAKRFDRAEQTFREILAAHPGHADALNYLGYMLADRGARLDEAVVLISRALAIEHDNPSFLDSLGWAYVKQARLDRARDPLQRAAAALPTTSVVQDHLGELYFRLKLYREAVAAWDRALEGDRAGIDVGAITKKRNRAKAMAKE